MRSCLDGRPSSALEGNCRADAVTNAAAVSSCRQRPHEEDEMARIPAVPAEKAGVIGRLVYRYAQRRFGAMPEPLAVSRHHRRLFWAGLVAESAYQWAATTLPARVRDLAVYRVATVVGCSWCVDFGTMMQRLEGLDVERLQHIDEYATNPLYTADERLAIAYADAMTAQPTTVTDEMVA